MKNELLNCERAGISEVIPLLDYIYVIQTRKKHESGYMCMEIIGETLDGYKKKLATFSDVIDLDSACKNGTWLLGIDIPEYNVMRIFTHRSEYKFQVNTYGISTFSFEIVEVEK